MIKLYVWIIMEEKSIVGDLINFRGLVYAPLNENGVIFLFGKVMEDLNMYVEEIKPGFPDCIARRFTGKGWARIRIEFEYKSKNFETHGHNQNECDMIVCWEHNWENCPKNLEIIELKDTIKGLEPRPVTKPDITKEETSYVEIPENLRDLITDLLNYFKTFSEEIVVKRVKLGFTIYSPQKVFSYIYFRKNYLRLMIFTRGETIENVELAESGAGGQKWGYLLINNNDELERYKPILNRSYDLIIDAISCNEPTGYYAKIDIE